MKPIIRAILDNDLEKLKRINELDQLRIFDVAEDGTAAPLCAARSSDIDIVEYIVCYTRAGMDMRDERHRTMLHYAAENPRLEVVQFLTETVGLDPCDGDAQGDTPMETAQRLGNIRVLEYFESITGCRLKDMYKNPVRTGAFPDPSAVRTGDDYYMVNSSFTYFPCIPVSHSKDLVHWEIIGHAITKEEYSGLEGLESGRGYWAPDISYVPDASGKGGKYYITATLRFNDDGTVYRRQMIVSSDRPEGPYSKPVFIDEDGIDPSLFHDDDGRHYMLLNRGARILELDSSLTHAISKPRLLWYGDNKHASEGPHLIKREGWYYLFLAEGGTGIGHRISVGRSRTLYGPYQSCPYNPVLRQYDPDAMLQRTGHGKPLQAQDGSWYIPYLCGRFVNGQHTVRGRETALDPMVWTEDGWPLINDGKGPSCLQKYPSFCRKNHEYVSREADGFWQEKDGSRSLAMDWMWSKLPSKGGHQFLDNGGIRIHGSRLAMHDRDARNILVRRQTSLKFSYTVKLSAVIDRDGDEAGLTCYYDENTWLSFSLTRKNQEVMLRVCEQRGELHLDSITQKIKGSTEDIEMRIDTDVFKRTFFWKRAGETEYHKFGTIDNVNYLCDEGYNKGKRFTGAMYGVYVYGEKAYADFYFEKNKKSACNL